MIKNAFLSIKKNKGKTFLLFVLMCVIANLVIAGLSIKEATSRSMAQVREALGSEVTFSYNMQNLMKNREKGASMDEVMNSITMTMADQLKDLDYVEGYNYTVNIGVTSEDIEPVKISQDSTDQGSQNNEKVQPTMQDQNDFTVIGNTTMMYLEDFTNENYILKSGQLLTTDDVDTNSCVVSSVLASDNDLSVGDTIHVSTYHNGNNVNVELKIAGIYEIQTSSEIGMIMSHRQNPMNYIYTDLSIAQQLNGNMEDITSATYYLDDPHHIEDFKTQAMEKTDIDFDIYSLDANDRAYQNSIATLENIEKFATLFLWIVIIAGSVILCLILVLTLRNRFYEFGVLLSLGASKIKIMLQQFVEIGVIASIAFILSLTTGKMVSNVVGSLLESSQNTQSKVVMEIPEENHERKEEQFKEGLLEKAMNAPVNSELDVSMTTSTMIQLAEVTVLICIVSIALPSVYILRLSPREILVKKEG